ncbi:MAG TPA: 30S ribosomal protein S9 [Acidobacteriota bacterium]|nr:30S ribosomal protein S9 [Acidobacteriota bacterium]
MLQWHGVGKRKRSVARVYLRPGTGEIVVNKRHVEDYFPNAVLRSVISQPLVHTETAEKMNVFVNVRGGGISGQAGAVRLGISRALVVYSHELRDPLKKAGFLTRDSRIVERKKYGQKKARKRFQYSKR